MINKYELNISMILTFTIFDIIIRKYRFRFPVIISQILFDESATLFDY